jgi:ketosteroid isomerase-like protein
MTTSAELTETNRALMQRLYDAAVAGEYDTVLACLHPDLVVHEPHFLPYGGTYRGIDAFAAMIPKVVELMDLTRMRVERYIAEHDRVIGIIRMPDRSTGDDVLLAEESVIRDGKVIEINVYYNNAQTLVRA